MAEPAIPAANAIEAADASAVAVHSASLVFMSISSFKRWFVQLEASLTVPT
jgi:hypothetical protein